MELPPETLSLFEKVKKRLDRAEKMMENACALLEPIVEAALERDDADELNELVRRLPSVFYRAQIRGHLMRNEKYEKRQ